MAEGRAQLGREQARNAVEFALAANLLGVDRGIDAFVRFGFLKRNGLAFLAAPLGRIKVKRRPDARLLDDPALREWIDRLRRACSDKEKTPARYQSALRNIDRAIFTFASRSETGNDAPYLLKVLRSIGQAERTLAGGLSFAKDKYIRPLTDLSSQWLTRADDNSPEFRLAVSLAGMQATRKQEVGPIRAFLEEVEVTKFVNWNPGSTSAVWSKQPLAKNLAAIFRRRQLEAFREGVEGGVPIRSHTFARFDDVLAFLNEEIDDEKLADLLWGLICVEPPKEPLRLEPSEKNIPFEFGAPRLLVNASCIAPRGDFWNIVYGEPNAIHDPDVFHHLATDRRDAVSQCVTRAARRLKSGGLLIVGYRNRRHAGRPIEIDSSFHPTRLLASMLFPISNHDLERIANIVLYPTEDNSHAN
jgi:CRISPR-associated protein Csx17